MLSLDASCNPHTASSKYAAPCCVRLTTAPCMHAFTCCTFLHVTNTAGVVRQACLRTSLRRPSPSSWRTSAQAGPAHQSPARQATAATAAAQQQQHSRRQPTPTRPRTGQQRAASSSSSRAGMAGMERQRHQLRLAGMGPRLAGRTRVPPQQEDTARPRLAMVLLLAARLPAAATGSSSSRLCRLRPRCLLLLVVWVLAATARQPATAAARGTDSRRAGMGLTDSSSSSRSSRLGRCISPSALPRQHRYSRLGLQVCAFRRCLWCGLVVLHGFVVGMTAMPAFLPTSYLTHQITCTFSSPTPPPSHHTNRRLRCRSPPSRPWRQQHPARRASRAHTHLLCQPLGAASR